MTLNVWAQLLYLCPTIMSGENDGNSPRFLRDYEMRNVWSPARQRHRLTCQTSINGKRVLIPPFTSFCEWKKCSWVCVMHGTLFHQHSPLWVDNISSIFSMENGITLREGLYMLIVPRLMSCTWSWNTCRFCRSIIESCFNLAEWMNYTLKISRAQMQYTIAAPWYYVAVVSPCIKYKRQPG